MKQIFFRVPSLQGKALVYIPSRFPIVIYEFLGFLVMIFLFRFLGKLVLSASQYTIRSTGGSSLITKLKLDL